MILRVIFFNGCLTQALKYADSFHFWGNKISVIKDKANILLLATKEMDLEVGVSVLVLYTLYNTTGVKL